MKLYELKQNETAIVFRSNFYSIASFFDISKQYGKSDQKCFFESFLEFETYFE